MYYYTKTLITKTQKEEYKLFLQIGGLEYEETQYQLGVYDNNKLIGGISLDKNCIKLLRVDDEYNGQGISNLLISEIINYAYTKDIVDLYVYTNPDNEDIFHTQGFYTIFKTSDVLFLENNRTGIRDYVEKLQTYYNHNFKRVCGLVMNLNPITLGHEYLIKKACEENDFVHLFLVKEDKSIFPYDVRLALAEEVCKKYKNIIVHQGSDYIISSATFPTYFLKSKDNIPNIYATLDVNIFGKYIAKALGINVRYIGTEPYSRTTNMYNDVMKKILPQYDIEVVEVYRKQTQYEYISAKKVRELIKKDNFQEACRLLPEETIKFLKSDRGKVIIEKIKKNDNRH